MKIMDILVRDAVILDVTSDSKSGGDGAVPG